MIYPVFQEVVSSVVGNGGGAAAAGVGTGGSLMQASKFTGVSFPRIELEPPVGDKIGSDMMCS